jgi:hypothetical protein
MTTEDKKTYPEETIKLIHEMAEFFPREEIYAELENVYNEILPLFTSVAKENSWDISDEVMEMIVRIATEDLYALGIAYACATGQMGFSAEDAKDICLGILDAFYEESEEILQNIKDLKS